MSKNRYHNRLPSWISKDSLDISNDRALGRHGPRRPQQQIVMALNIVMPVFHEILSRSHPYLNHIYQKLRHEGH